MVKKMELIDLRKNLKPCPFCGSEDIYVTFEHGYLDVSAVVFCNTCKVSAKLEDNDQEGFNDRTARMAVDAWNKRVYESVDERKES